MATFLCYEKCSTCKKAQKWLDERGISYVMRPIREQHPSIEELREWHKKSGLSLKRFLTPQASFTGSLG